MNTILIIWSGNEDEDEDETDCPMDHDKCSYNEMKYEHNSTIMLNLGDQWISSYDI